MRHIISFSGGKDSTAMLLRMIELGMPIDEVRYFDCGSWEFPHIHRHIDLVEKIMGTPVLRMKHRYSFDYLFFEKKTVKGFIGYGFPTMVYRWCTGKKMDTLNKGVSKEDVQYIGYTTDELTRMQNSLRRRSNNRFPLIEWGWGEKDCLEYCYSKGFNWDGLYGIFDRVSCWCCPFQGISELRRLRKHFPDLWLKLLDMQNTMLEKKREDYSVHDKAISFRMDGTTVFDLERRFTDEDRQMELFEK